MHVKNGVSHLGCQKKVISNSAPRKILRITRARETDRKRSTRYMGENGENNIALNDILESDSTLLCILEILEQFLVRESV